MQEYKNKIVTAIGQGNLLPLKDLLKKNPHINEPLDQAMLYSYFISEAIGKNNPQAIPVLIDAFNKDCTDAPSMLSQLIIYHSFVNAAKINHRVAMETVLNYVFHDSLTGIALLMRFTKSKNLKLLPHFAKDETISAIPLLLTYEETIAQEDYSKQVSLAFEQALINKDKPAIKSLLSYGAPVEDNLLGFALNHRLSIEMIALFLSYGAHFENKNETNYLRGDSHIEAAVRNNRPAVVKLLADEGAVLSSDLINLVGPKDYKMKKLLTDLGEGPYGMTFQTKAYQEYDLFGFRILLAGLLKDWPVELIGLVLEYTYDHENALSDFKNKRMKFCGQLEQDKKSLGQSPLQLEIARLINLLKPKHGVQLPSQTSVICINWLVQLANRRIDVPDFVLQNFIPMVNEAHRLLFPQFQPLESKPNQKEKRPSSPIGFFDTYQEAYREPLLTLELEEFKENKIT